MRKKQSSSPAENGLRPGLRQLSPVLVLGLLLACLVSAQSPLQVGYTIFTADRGSSAPMGSALFTVTNSAGIVVSQAGVGAVEPIRRGRVFVDEAGPLTGIALVNSSLSTATITLILRNSGGVEIARDTQTLGAGRHLPRFTSQLFSTQARGLHGSLTFESDVPLAAVTLRQNQNAYGEALYTTLPVVDLAAPPSTEPVIFPDIAVGGGYTTELLLMNPGTDAIRGEVRLYGSDGQPLSLLNNGQQVSQLTYDIAANGIFRAELDAARLSVGWALAVPSSGTRSPAGSAIFQVRSNRQIVSEAGVAATLTTTRARLFVDNSLTQTGVAVVNPSDLPAELALTLMDRNGNVEETLNKTLPARNHLAKFAGELFPGLTEGFTGVMEIRSNVPVAPVPLKLTINSRGDQVLTTLPVADLVRVSSATTLIFPHIAIGGEFSTRLIFLNPDTRTGLSGQLSFYQSDGNTMVVPLGRETGSQFQYNLSAGGGRQFYPGNTARVGLITLVDAASNSETSELVVNEGNTIRPRVRILDSAAQSRDDFDVSYTASNSDIAAVNADGSIAARRAGFTTLTLSAGGAVWRGTITVVRVDAGVSGFDVTGIVQDFARRVYLASSQDHTILLAQDVRQPPARYAGTTRSPGLKDDLRLQSQFRNPAFLALNQAEGSLYVTDTANHVIRRVRPGESGRVETLAGTGLPGSGDGSFREASFNQPQGIALDSRGNLWVADTGSHAIRRISLVSGRVETIAGSPGVPGFADGRRTTAQFRSPVGIAIDTESTLEQLERERRGQPPPLVSVIVADTGNGVLRRVRENGEVETLRLTNAFASRFTDFKTGRVTAIGSPFTFANPTGVLVDASDNIYVTEPASGRVRVLLSGRDEVVTAAQNNTFHRPRGLSATTSGSLVVADSTLAVQQLSYGGPRITNVTPGTISDRGGEQITIRGTNFAPDTVVVIGDIVVAGAAIQDTETITFTAPVVGSGRTTITVQNRGGLDQAPLLVEPQPLSALPVGYITTIAGGTTFAGDGGAATSARVYNPGDVATDSVGAVYILEENNHRIRRVDPRTGIINTVVGSGQAGFSGDGGPATAAQLDHPSGIAVDVAGNILISDSYNARIRRVDSATGTITTVAGKGVYASTGDGGPATQAAVAWPEGIAADSVGNIYFCEQNYRVRKIDAKTGIITTIAGTGRRGFSGDNGPATLAQLDHAWSIAADSEGRVYLADTRNYRIRKIDPNSGIITTVAGIGLSYGPPGDNGPAIAANLDYPVGVNVDAVGNLYIVDSSTVREVIRKVDAVTGIITTVAGGGQVPPSTTESIPALSASIGLEEVAADAAGNLYISDHFGHRMYRVAANTGRLSIFAGIGAGSVGDGEPATTATLNQPSGIAFDTNGNLLIADTWNQRVRRVDTRTGVITTIAGTGLASGEGDEGDGGPATSAKLSYPERIALDRAGNIYFTETDRIRKIAAATGIISTLAEADEIPDGLAADEAGNLYVSVEDAVYRLSTDGMVTTAAGGGSPDSGIGDTGPATSAYINRARGLALDAAGNLYIADNGNRRIRKVTLSTGIITTYAQVPLVPGPGSDYPTSLSFDSTGNLFVLGYVLNRISNTGLTQFIAGTAFQDGRSGDNGPASRALFHLAQDVAVDTHGNIFIADTGNNRIRVIKGPLP